MRNPLADDPRLAKIYEADAALTAPGMPYEIVEDDVLGERMPVFRNRHANLREQLLAGAARYGDGDLFVWSDGRRQTFSGIVAEVAEVAAGLRRDNYGITKGRPRRHLLGEQPGVDPHVLRRARRRCGCWSR